MDSTEKLQEKLESLVEIDESLKDNKIEVNNISCKIDDDKIFFYIETSSKVKDYTYLKYSIYNNKNKIIDNSLSTPGIGASKKARRTVQTLTLYNTDPNDISKILIWLQA